MDRKILFLNHNYENYGTYFRCFYLAKHLSDLRYNVTLICASGGNFDLKIRVKKLNENFNVMTLPRIKLHEYHTGHLMRMFINSEIMALRDFDILHSFAVAQPTTAIPTLLCKFFRRKPTVVDWDDDWSDGLGRYHPYPVWAAVSYLEKNIPKIADRITVVSEFLKNKALQFGYDSKKIFKIPNGSDIDAIKPMDINEARRYLKIDPEELIILSLGHTYMESMDVLLNAYSKVILLNPRIKLYVVGRMGRTLGKIKERFPDLIDKVNFTGEQPFHKIPYYLCAANVLVLPMENSPMECSRFPIRLGDYLASGRPIVSNAVGEVKYVLESERCGLTSEPENADNFASNMLTVLNNKDLQIALGRNARQAAEERYSWSKIAADLSSVYRSIN